MASGEASCVILRWKLRSHVACCWGWHSAQAAAAENSPSAPWFGTLTAISTCSGTAAFFCVDGVRSSQNARANPKSVRKNTRIRIGCCILRAVGFSLIECYPPHQSLSTCSDGHQFPERAIDSVVGVSKPQRGGSHSTSDVAILRFSVLFGRHSLHQATLSRPKITAGDPMQGHSRDVGLKILGRISMGWIFGPKEINDCARRAKTAIL